MGDDGGLVQGLVGDDPGCDTTESTPTFGRPNLFPQESEAHLDEAVVKVREHYIVAAVGQGVIEDYRTNLARVRVREPLGGPSPAPGQVRQVEHFSGETRHVCRDQGRLVGELKPDLHYRANVLWRESQLALALL